MEWQKLVIDIFVQISKVLERALDGLTTEDLNYRPSHDTNSMGWLAWHIVRGQDRGIAGLLGEEQLWVKDGWHAKFNRPADPQDFGLSHTPEDVAAFESPDVSILAGYQQAVLSQTKRYLSQNLSEAELDREIDHPRFKNVEARLAAMINDNLQHDGQVAYLRGLLKGKGWLDV
ncbi:MAG: DinB family protein [Chloroflexi bacterium]|nr:DinB family protein [Chloroflexota bacterium]